jgi:hypothetical protein
MHGRTKSAREEDFGLASVEARRRLLLGLCSAHVSAAVPESQRSLDHRGG